MNTQPNTTQPTIDLNTVNIDLLNLISDIVMEDMEENTKYVQALVEFNAAIQAVPKLLDVEMLRALEDAPWFLAIPFGHAMFLKGVEIGRDPLTILTLPERPTLR
jgi:hypothetical protein